MSVIRRPNGVYSGIATHLAKKYGKGIAKSLYNSANGGNSRHSRYMTKKKTGGGKKKPPSKKKVESQEGAVDYAVHNLSCSKCSTYHKAPKTQLPLIKNTPQQYELFNDGNFNKGVSGQQLFVDNPRTILDYTMLASIFGSYDSGVEKKIFIKYVTQTWNITNVQNSVVEIVIWDLIAKRDLLTSGAPQNSIKDGIGARYSATTTSFGPTPGTPNTTAWLQPYMNPKESEMFNRSWGVVKRTRVVIPPGGQHRHVVYHAVNKRFDNQWDRSDATAGNYQFFKGITRVSLLQALGATIPNAAEGASPTGATTAIPILAHIMRTQVSFCVPQGVQAQDVTGLVQNTLTAATGAVTLPETGTQVNTLT